VANSATLQGTATNAATANGATLDIAIPTCSAGDVLVVHASAANTAAATWSAAVLSPAHSLGAPQGQISRASLDSAAWIYTAQTGDSNGTLRITSSVPGHLIVGTLTVLRNVGALDVALPLVLSAASTTSSLNPVAPSVTTTGADDTVMTLYAENDSAGRVWSTNWAGGTIACQEHTAAVAAGITSATYLQLDRAAAGATGTLTGTVASPPNQWTAITIAFKAKIANQPPVANSGPNQTVAPGALVTLDGSGSTDPDGTIASYSWAQASGTTVSLSGSGVAKPTFTAPSLPAGDTLVFNLSVTDNLGLQSTSGSSVTIFVNGTGAATGLGFRDSISAQGPTGTAATCGTPAGTVTGDQMIAFVDAHVVSATDAFVTPAGWTKVLGSDWPGSNQYGVYRKIAASGDAGGAGSVSVTWATNPGKWQIHVLAYKGALAAPQDAQVTLETTARTAHPAPNLNAASTVGCWRIGHAADENGPASTSLTPSATPTPVIIVREQFYQAGGGSFACATGDTGAPVSTGTITGGTWTGTISTNNAYVVSLLLAPSAANLPPVADAGANQSGVEPFDTVTLDGSGSSDPEGGTLTYAWTRISGPAVTLSSSTAQRPTFLAPGLIAGATLVFGLVVTDNGSPPAVSPQDTVQVAVLPAYRFMAKASSWQAVQRLQPHTGSWR